MQRESATKTKLRYHRRYTDLVKEAHDRDGRTPAQAAPIAQARLAEEWAAETGGAALPEWWPFQGATA